MDKFYKEVEGDIAEFVVELWEAGTEEQKVKIWKYIRKMGLYPILRKSGGGR